MKQPDVRTTMTDTGADITYHVIAYRSLTRNEVLGCIRAYLNQKRRPKPKRGQEITIFTIIGHDA